MENIAQHIRESYEDGWDESKYGFSELISFFGGNMRPTTDRFNQRFPEAEWSMTEMRSKLIGYINAVRFCWLEDIFV
jgi:hypothetical protein